MAEQEDACFTFSDEDFERRYCSEDTAPAANPSVPATQQTKPLVARLARSRNRYMSTLLRRRFAASGRS